MINQDILVDVLLPTFNGKIYLKDQIESILNQSYSNIRLIIRDDGSTDGTQDIIKEISHRDDRIKIIEDTEGNLGLVKSIEKLLSISDAGLIFFADQDDYWIKNKIELFLKNYNKNNGPLLIHSNCYVTDNELQVKGLFFHNVEKKNGLKDSLFHFFVQGSSSMINSELKKYLLPFPENVYVHDRYIHIISEMVGKRIYINQPTMYYRQHGNNLIGTSSLIQKIKANLKLRTFYLIEDKILLKRISEIFSENELLKIYDKITGNHISRFERFKMLKQYGITTRLKEKILIILKN